MQKTRSRIEIIIMLIVVLVISRLYINNNSLITVPYDIKCFFGEDKCWKGDIDNSIFLQILAFFLIGFLVPDQYLFVFVITLGYEIAKPFVGLPAKIIINPLVNITAYSLGSLISKRRKLHLKEKYKRI